jgi:hemerythrin superfamily protein
MDCTKLLEADHRQVEDLLERIAEAKGDAVTPLVEQLATSLQAHMELEEQVLYPAMKPVTGEEMVEEGVTEHDLARKALQDVISLAPEEPGFEAALEVIKAGIKHHVEDEEGEVFPQLRSDGQQVLEQVEAPFLAKRAEVGLPMDADALEQAMTKEELLEEARKAELEGTSSMSKAELAAALAERLATA